MSWVYAIELFMYVVIYIGIYNSENLSYIGKYEAETFRLNLVLKMEHRFIKVYAPFVWRDYKG